MYLGVVLTLCFQVGSYAYDNDDGTSQQNSTGRLEQPSWPEDSPSDPQSYHLVTEHPEIYKFSLTSFGSVLEHGCALLAISPCKESLRLVLSELRTIFKNDEHVYIGVLVESENSSTPAGGFSAESDRKTVNGTSTEYANSSFVEKIKWKSSFLKQVDEMKANGDPPVLAFYEREPKDRTCLLMPPKSQFLAEPYRGQLIIETLVQFLNERCGTFRTPKGSLTAAGMFHDHIMKHLYTPREAEEDCPRIKMPQMAYFFQEFLFRSRPVVIENAIRDWPAMTKWSTEYLRSLYSEKEIHIKLTEDGNFEGVENAEDWANYREDWIPKEVKSQLPFPDLVVVRPATSEMKFSDFLDFISTRNNSTYSAYLEYSSIPYYMPQLEEDIHELSFLKNHLERRHLNMWLSDGNTLGKLHFDPYDNFLCQVKFSKVIHIVLTHMCMAQPHLLYSTFMCMRSIF